MNQVERGLFFNPPQSGRKQLPSHRVSQLHYAHYSRLGTYAIDLAEISATKQCEVRGCSVLITRARLYYSHTWVSPKIPGGLIFCRYQG